MKKTIRKNLSIKKIHASIGGKKILRGISLDIAEGETHIILGPNGSGKSTLLSVIMGDPRFAVTSGSISLEKKNITTLSPDARAHRGIFLAFQQPPEIPGVSIGNFLRLASNALAVAHDPRAVPISPMDFAKKIRPQFGMVGLDQSFLGRSLNEGFSGGERKKSETLHMMALRPSFAFLDEVDSGLDVDAQKQILESLVRTQKETGCALILVTHNTSILSHIRPQAVHVLLNGKIRVSGGAALVKKVIAHGFESR